jgi:hypothetical protein
MGNDASEHLPGLQNQPGRRVVAVLPDVPDKAQALVSSRDAEKRCDHANYDPEGTDEQGKPELRPTGCRAASKADRMLRFSSKDCVATFSAEAVACLVCTLLHS